MAAYLLVCEFTIPGPVYRFTALELRMKTTGMLARPYEPVWATALQAFDLNH